MPSDGDKSLSPRIWRTREIGILFRQDRTTTRWTFLILIGPLAGPSEKIEDLKEEHFKFCYRKRKNGPCTSWTSAEGNIHDFKNNIMGNLNIFGTAFLSCLLQDVYWGWQRFLSQAKNDIRRVSDTGDYN